MVIDWKLKISLKISLSNKLKTIDNQKVTLLKKLQSVDSTSPCYLSRKEWHLFQLSDLCTQEHEPVYINLKISMPFIYYILNGFQITIT